MTWVRFDDTFPIHRKVEGATDAAYRLHTSAIFWCARNLTDGFVPSQDLELVSARVKSPRKYAAELVSRGLWIERDGGWEINDYLKFQPSKEKVLADREDAAERQRKWRESRKSGRNGSSNAVTDGVSNTTPPRPAPLPSGERGGRGKPSRRLEVVHAWCGQCTEDTRHIQLEDGRVARCPRCNPNRKVS